MLVDSADGVNEADEGIGEERARRAKKEKEPRRDRREIKRDMTVTRLKLTGPGRRRRSKMRPGPGSLRYTF